MPGFLYGLSLATYGSSFLMVSRLVLIEDPRSLKGDEWILVG